MFLSHWLRGLQSRVLGPGRTRQQRAPRRRSRKGLAAAADVSFSRGVEVLEDRTLLTATLFIDYGDNFSDPDGPSGPTPPTLTTSQGAFRDVANDDTPANRILGTTLNDANNNFNAGTRLDIQAQSFSATERAQILAIVQRIYLPLNVNVVELTANLQLTPDGRLVTGATNMQDVIDTLRTKPANYSDDDATDSRDAYVFVGQFIVDPENADNRRVYKNGGNSPGFSLGDDQTDLGSGSNVHDDVAVAYSDGSSAIGIGETISHEAGHLFGVRHALTARAVSDATNLFHQAEVMSYRVVSTSQMFTRYPMIHGNENSPEIQTEVTINAAGRTIIRTDGDFIVDGLSAGRQIYLLDAGAKNEGVHTIQSLSSTVLTLTEDSDLDDFSGKVKIPWGPKDYDDVAARAGAVTVFGQLVFDANVGPNPQYGVIPETGLPQTTFVSGTGAHDIITITRNGANADVTVQAFAVAVADADTDDYKDPIRVPGEADTIFSYSIPLTRPILVYGGDSNDRIIINGDLGVDVQIDGMLGTDTLVVDGLSAATATYTPNSSSRAGVDINAAGNAVTDFGGVVVIGGSSIIFNNFETTGSVTIQNVATVTVETSDDDDVLNIRRDGANERLFGSNAGTSIVPLTLVNIASANLNTNRGADTVNLISFSNTTNWTVHAGAGDDDLQVSPFDSDLSWLQSNSNIRFSFFGDTGADDQISIFNAFSSQSTRHTFTGPEFGQPAGIFQDGRGWLLGYGSVDEISFFGSASARDEFDVRHVPQGTELTLKGNGGNDEFEIGGGDYFAKIRGEVSINGDGGDDELFLNDAQAETGFGALGQLIEDEYSLESRTFRKSLTTTLFGDPDTFDAPVLTFDSIAEVTLNASGTTDFGAPETSPSTINITSLAAGTTLTVNANAGDDVINFNASAADVTVTLNAGSGNDAVNINQSGAGASISVNGNDGTDKFVVWGGGSETLGGDYDTFIKGPVTIHGGTGDDELVIDDRRDLADDSYVLDRLGLSFFIGTFTKVSSGISVPVLSFSEVDSLELHGSRGNNLFQVDGTIRGADYTLRGNDGADSFRIDGLGQQSDVRVSGGGPTSAPGDSLNVFGLGLLNATHTPDLNNPDAGTVTTSSVFSPGTVRSTITFAGLERVSVEGFAAVTMITPRSFDIINVTPEADGWTRISGTSGHPVLPLPFESLSFRDVRHVTLDTAARDLVSFEFPPGSGQVFPPVPNDTVDIEQGALNARGLESFSVLTGFGFNIVDDHTLEGPASSVTLAVRGQVAYMTKHVVYGTAARLDAELRDHDGATNGPFNTVIAYDSVGNIIHQFEDELGGIVQFLQQQPDVQVTLDGTNATLGNGQIAGAGLSVVELHPTTDGRLRVLPVADMTINILDTLFPNFEFAPIFGLDVSPIGTFHVYPVNSTRFIEDVSVERAVLKANDAPAGGYAAVFFAIPALDSGFRDVDGDGSKDVFVATPAFSSTLFHDDMILNGASQQLYTGDTNPFGPEIVLDGAFAMNNALRLISDNNIVHGLGIHSFNQAAVVVGGSGNIVSGNYIGVDPTGTLAPGNGGAGVFIAGGGQDDPTVGNLITGNLISGNDAGGVEISGDFAFENVISHNRIGTDRAGSLAIGNSVGVSIEFAQSNDIVNNQIAGNGVGVQLSQFASGNLIQNNEIGSAATGGLGNAADGILVDGAFGNGIWDNVIAGNGGNGVTVLGGFGNSLLRNATYSNAGLGIDLGGDGVTPNDFGDSDAGPNDLQNYPELLSAQSEALTRVVGTINSTPNTSILLDFFANASLDASGFGEGQRWLESKTITTDGNGNAQFDYLLDAATAVGEWITATATGDTSSTSEFSGGVATDVAMFRAVTNTNDAGPGSLRDAIDAANQTAGDDPLEVLFAIPDTDPNFIDVDSQLGGDADPDVFVISPLSALPALTRGNTIINGASQQALTDDSNPFGPEIVLAGSFAGTDANGLHLASSGNLVHGLNIQQFSGDGVLIDATPDTSLNGLVDKSTFLAATGAQPVAEYENLGAVPNTYTTTDGKVTITAHGLHVGALPGTGVVNDDWTLRLPGPDLAAGLENFTFDLSAPAYAFGFDFVEPILDPNVNVGAPIDSTFRLVLHNGAAEVGTFTFNAPNDAASFIPARSGVPFDRVEMTEIVGNHDNEFIGRIYISHTPPAANGNTLSGSYIGTDATGASSETGTEVIVLSWPTVAQNAEQIVGPPDGDIVTLADGATAQFSSFSQSTAIDRSDLAAILGISTSTLDTIDFVAFEQNGLPDFGFESSQWDFDDGTTTVSVTHTAGGGPNGPIIKNGSISAPVFNSLFGTGTAGEGVSVGFLLFDFAESGLNAAAADVTVSGGTGDTIGNAPDVLAVAVLSTPTTATGNGGDGVRIVDSSGNLIGGTTDADRNVISGNTGSGISIVGSTPESKTQAFADAAQVAREWTGFGNFANRDSFGHALSNRTSIDGTLGEAGGVFARASTALGETFEPVSYYADPHLGGTLTLDNAIHADGELLVTDPHDWNQNIHIGHFDRSDAEANLSRNSIGLVVLEPDARTGTTGIRAAAYLRMASGPEIFGSLVNAPGGLLPDVLYTWRYDYDPVGGAEGAGELVLEVFADGVSLGTSRIELTTNQREEVGAGFDAFGLRNGGYAARSNNPNTVEVYTDNVTYTRVVGNTIQGNHIGVGVDGKTNLGNFDGVVVSGGAAANLIGGAAEGERNVISGNSRIGVFVTGDNDTTIQGNYIGTDATGTQAVANFSAGIALLAATNTLIGGVDPGAGNVISGNGNGIQMGASIATQTVRVEGNRIGTTADGHHALGNNVGIQIIGSGSFQVFDAMIGGTDPGAGNLISGNANEGILVRGEGAQEVHIQGNLIGTDIDGVDALPNGTGVILQDTTGNTLRGNVISGNDNHGVHVFGIVSTDLTNLIEANYIGTTADGMSRLGNGASGVYIDNSAGNLIGTMGTDPNNNPEANVIAYNTGSGVSIVGEGSSGNRIRGNSIHSNGGLGIDLGADGVTPNDDLDADPGPNLLQNVPEFTSAVLVRGDARFSITLESTISSHYTIDIYTSSEKDPSGSGEGRRWLGPVEVDTNRQGSVSFSRSLPGLLAGEFLTATATDAFGNTSEFSRAVEIVEPGGGGPGGPGGGRPLLAATGGPSGGDASPPTLTMAVLHPVFTAAIDAWRQAGAQADFIQDIDLAVIDLPGTELGRADGRMIAFDVDAAGAGWFIDLTPWEHSEFTTVEVGELVAAGDSAAARRYDLLSVAIHELGHALGLEHAEHGAMAGTIPIGTRRLPATADEPTESVPRDGLLPDFNSGCDFDQQLAAGPPPAAIAAAAPPRDFGFADDHEDEWPTDLAGGWLPDPDEAYDPDALFADFNGSLADELLTV